MIPDLFNGSKLREGLLLLRGQDSQLTQNLNRHRRADAVAGSEIVCHAGGIAIRVVAAFLAVHDEGLTFILLMLFGAGFCLLAVPMFRQLYSPSKMTWREPTGCLVWTIGGFIAMFVVLSTMTNR